MAEIRWTSEAEVWLKDIYDYITQDNPSAAARVVEGIYEKAQILRQFPDIGYRYRSEEEGEIRILLYGGETPKVKTANVSLVQEQNSFTTRFYKSFRSEGAPLPKKFFVPESGACPYNG